jgi:hypothetical protein
MEFAVNSFTLLCFLVQLAVIPSALSAGAMTSERKRRFHDVLRRR